MAWIIDKSVDEVQDFAAEMKDSWQRRTWVQRLFKIPVDIPVEAFRLMPYTLGHIVAYYFIAKWGAIPLIDLVLNTNLYDLLF